MSMLGIFYPLLLGVLAATAIGTWFLFVDIVMEHLKQRMLDNDSGAGRR